MGAVSPVMYTTPDGVERPLRFTMGARRRIAIEFGTANIQTILGQYDYGAVPRLVYQLLYDEKGQPPSFTVQEFEESFPNDSEVGDAAIAALMSAALQGRVPKKELEAAIKEYQQEPDWIKLWAFGIGNLGLSDEQFWGLHPAEFDALAERYRERERIANYRAGIVAAAVLNTHRTADSEPIRPLDFFERRRSAGIRPAWKVLRDMERAAAATHRGNDGG